MNATVDCAPSYYAYSGSANLYVAFFPSPSIDLDLPSNTADRVLYALEGRNYASMEHPVHKTYDFDFEIAFKLHSSYWDWSYYAQGMQMVASVIGTYEETWPEARATLSNVKLI